MSRSVRIRDLSRKCSSPPAIERLGDREIEISVDMTAQCSPKALLLLGCHGRFCWIVQLRVLPYTGSWRLAAGAWQLD